MDFKKTFLKLTQWTIPHGYEETITHLLPKGMEKDEIGNYRMVIGESETLFTCHLDTVSTRMKINHIIQGDIIRTDGSSILGGDNKAGVCILMYMIEQGVPGTYYFFVGEETGCIGSRWALRNDTDYFRKFKRAIAFDRKKTGSIITKQRGTICVSNDFAETLSKEYIKNGVQYRPDDTGVYTDTAVFMGIIPECTNISAAVWGEHTKDEYVNIKTIEVIAQASAKIEWEKLPTKRQAKEEEKEKKKTTTYYGYGDDYHGQSHYNRNYNNRNNNVSYGQGQSSNFGINKKDDEGTPVDGSSLKFTVDNIPLFFQLTKIENYGDEHNYFADSDGDTWIITISDDTVSIAKELQNGMPDIVYHESLKTNIPKSFNELWERIKEVVPIKRRKSKKVTGGTSQNSTIKEIKRNLTLVVPSGVSSFDIKSIIDNDNRIQGFEVIKSGTTSASDKKYFDIALVFNSNKAYEVISNIVESTIEKFKNRLGAIVSTKPGVVKGSDKVDVKTEVLGINSIKVENVDKVFTLKKVKVGEDSVFKERFEDEQGNVYSIDIENGKIGIFLIKGSYRMLYHGTVKTWEDFYDKIKDKVSFKLKESEIPIYNNDNFDKAFDIEKTNEYGIIKYKFKGSKWTFSIKDDVTVIYKNFPSGTGQGLFVVKLEDVKSFDHFVEKVKASDRQLDPQDKRELFSLIDTYKFKKSIDDDDEEEEEDDE